MSVDETQVLTVTLGEQDYCVDIDYVAEIVDGGEMTTLPNTDEHVEGVIHRRGQTTTIVNPCTVLDAETVDAEELVTDGGQTQHRIVVFDSEATGAETTMGWLVSGVEEVTGVTEDPLGTDEISETDLLRGLIKEDDGFTLWLDPRKLVVWCGHYQFVNLGSDSFRALC